MATPTLPQNALSAQDAQIWAQKVPALIRGQAMSIPDTFTPPNNPYRIAGIGVGAVLGVATFTKAVSGKWKWLTGAAAVTSALGGVMMGSLVDKVNGAMLCALPEMKRSLVEYANALDSNPELQQQLAQYLSTSITLRDIQSGKLESAVIGKTIEFGQATPYINAKILANRVEQNCAHTFR